MNDKPSIPVLVQPAAGLALPAQLAEQAADAVRELLAEAAAENTTRSYATALRYWAGWFAARYGRELTLPVPEAAVLQFVVDHVQRRRSEEHTSELQSLMRISYAVFCLKKNNNHNTTI